MICCFSGLFGALLVWLHIFGLTIYLWLFVITLDGVFYCELT